MKNSILSLILLGLSALVLGAQDGGNEPAQKIDPWQEDFLNLPEDQRNEFGEHLTKAYELFGQKRIFETIEELYAAEKIFGDSPDVENLLGACQVEFRAFDKAMEHFERANKLSPNNPSVIFNIAEIYFVTKRWAEAERYFERVIEMANEAESEMPLSRLTQFKLMLCRIKTGEIEKAREMVGEPDLMDDSPFPYYAQAAIHYHDGEDIEAESALARAARIFQNPEILSPWRDTLMEFGYIKSFYGGDLNETP